MASENTKISNRSDKKMPKIQDEFDEEMPEIPDESTIVSNTSDNNNNNNSGDNNGGANNKTSGNEGDVNNNNNVKNNSTQYLNSTESFNNISIQTDAPKKVKSPGFFTKMKKAFSDRANLKNLLLIALGPVVIAINPVAGVAALIYGVKKFIDRTREINEKINSDFKQNNIATPSNINSRVPLQQQVQPQSQQQTQQGQQTQQMQKQAPQNLAINKKNTFNAKKRVEDKKKYEALLLEIKELIKKLERLKQAISSKKATSPRKETKPRSKKKPGPDQNTLNTTKLGNTRQGDGIQSPKSTLGQQSVNQQPQTAIQGIQSAVQGTQSAVQGTQQAAQTPKVFLTKESLGQALKETNTSSQTPSVAKNPLISNASAVKNPTPTPISKPPMGPKHESYKIPQIR